MNRFTIWIFGVLSMIAFFTSCNSNNGSKNNSFEKALSTNDSISLLTNEIKKDSADYSLWKNRAKLYLKRGNIDFAFRDLGKALDLNNSDPDLYILLSDIYFTIGKVDESFSSIKKAINLKPDNPDYYLKMAGFKLILESYKEAVSLADKALSLKPEDAKAYYIKAISALEQKDTAGAITLMKVAANYDTAFYAANFNLGVVLDAQHDTLAKVYFEKAIRNKPDDVIARYSLGLFYQKNGQFDKAFETYDELISLHPDNAAVYFNKGFIYLTEFLEFEKAKEQFEKAIEVKPDYTAAVYNLGRTYEVMGDTSMAIKKYREALHLTTNYPLAVDGLNRLEK